MLLLVLTSCATSHHYEIPTPVRFDSVHKSVAELRTSITNNDNQQKLLLHLGQVELRVSETEAENKRQFGELEKLTKDNNYLTDKYNHAVALLWKTRLLYGGLFIILGFLMGFFFTPILTFIVKLAGTFAKAP